MEHDASRSIDLLRLATGNLAAVFRPGQEEAISHVVEGRGRLLVVQATGWGKSLVYFIATEILRENGGGPTLLVSPLLSLMRNQIQAAERMGVVAATINSDNQDDWADVEARVSRDEVDILLISPERLANERFRSQVLAKIASRISLLVIDEAHCISDWGHDFRPHYRLIERIIGFLPPNLRLLATTATANDRVVADLEEILGPELTVSRGDLNRPSLRLQNIRLRTQAERLAWLAENVPAIDGSGIIYTLTVRDAEMVAAWLQSRGIDVESYTGETGDRRVELEGALLQNRVKALVATSALGMGFDKPDVAFVIHFQAPMSVVSYYQQVGRAGRATSAAYGILLSGEEETDIADYFIESAFPTRDEVRMVMAALEVEASGLTVPELLSRVNLSRGRIEKTLALLSLESPAPLIRQGSKYQLTAAALNDSFWERAERLTSLRRDELAEVREYISLSDGHMAYLIEALNGDAAELAIADFPLLPDSPSQPVVLEAIAFLKATSLPIEPRKAWPAGGLPTHGVRGNIGPALVNETGRALARWGDAGWGGIVRDGKYSHGHFADALVEACAALVIDWNPQPPPEWVTCIPSLRHPTLVPDFARRLAAKLGLPFEAVIVKTRATPEQKTMANSSQQALNLDGTLGVSRSPVPPGPVLLVDDMVDSRWTLTVAGWLLRRNGAPAVYPLVLAQAGFE